MPSAVSFRYARALVDVLIPPGASGPVHDPQDITAQLKEFEQVLEQSAELKILFGTPAIAAAKKRAVLAGIAPMIPLGATAHNFLAVVLQNERIALLGDIVEAFNQLVNERMGLVVAEISSAHPLGDAEKQQLDQALRARTGKQVQMSFTLDPTLIGGVLAQVGSTIYDGSVRGQLERLRAELAAQAAAAIS